MYTLSVMPFTASLLPSPQESLASGDYRMAILVVVCRAHPASVVETDILTTVFDALPEDYRGADPLDAAMDALIELVAEGLLMWEEPLSPASPLIYRMQLQPGGSA